MAEYIEREEVIRRLELSIKSWSADCNSNAEIMVTAYQDILERVKHIPTADVVPKSECDLYRKQVDELEDELAQTYDKLEKAKAEVAREIFEEIFTKCVDYNGYIEQPKLAELKKKYTEEQDIDVQRKD